MSKPEIDTCYNADCFDIMAEMPKNSVNFTLTDIPYGEVARETGTLSSLSGLSTGAMKSANDFSDFDLQKFLNEVYRVTSNSLCIFCGQEQFSEIRKYFDSKPGTTRTIVYEKTNPVPSNGKYVYLSGVELAVWFKKRGAHTFNGFCKNTVFRYPIYSGKKRTHPTQKHLDLFKELIKDNTNEGDIVFDPCAGGMTAAMAAKDCGRHYICCEIDQTFYDAGVAALNGN